MTKTIILSGGPEDGKLVTVQESQIQYFITTKPRASLTNSLLLSGETGLYEQSGEVIDGQEVFVWKGWKYK